MGVAIELPLEQGLRLEKRLFHQLFATRDQKEGKSRVPAELSSRCLRAVIATNGSSLY